MGFKILNQFLRFIVHCCYFAAQRLGLAYLRRNKSKADAFSIHSFNKTITEKSMKFICKNII